ncbi:hypothetical protein PCE1_002767 [Barthelona sp. PCE]
MPTGINPLETTVHFSTRSGYYVLPRKKTDPPVKIVDRSKPKVTDEDLFIPSERTAPFPRNIIADVMDEVEQHISRSVKQENLQALYDSAATQLHELFSDATINIKDPEFKISPDNMIVCHFEDDYKGFVGVDQSGRVLFREQLASPGKKISIGGNSQNLSIAVICEEFIVFYNFCDRKLVKLCKIQNSTFLENEEVETEKKEEKSSKKKKSSRDKDKSEEPQQENDEEEVVKKVIDVRLEGYFACIITTDQVLSFRIDDLLHRLESLEKEEAQGEESEEVLVDVEFVAKYKFDAYLDCENYVVRECSLSSDRDLFENSIDFECEHPTSVFVMSSNDHVYVLSIDFFKHEFKTFVVPFSIEKTILSDRFYIILTKQLIFVYDLAFLIFKTTLRHPCDYEDIVSVVCGRSNTLLVISDVNGCVHNLSRWFQFSSVHYSSYHEVDVDSLLLDAQKFAIIDKSAFKIPTYALSDDLLGMHIVVRDDSGISICFMDELLVLGRFPLSHSTIHKVEVNNGFCFSFVNDDGSFTLEFFNADKLVMKLFTELRKYKNLVGCDSYEVLRIASAFDRVENVSVEDVLEKFAPAFLKFPSLLNTHGIQAAKSPRVTSASLTLPSARSRRVQSGITHKSSKEVPKPVTSTWELRRLLKYYHDTSSLESQIVERLRKLRLASHEEINMIQ